MKVQNIILSALAAITLLASANANAATINYSWLNHNMGSVNAGDNGFIDTSPLANIHGVFYDYAEGILPSKTKITFSFATDPSVFSRYQYSFAEGVSQNSDGTYIYRSWAASDGWFKNERIDLAGNVTPTPPTFGVQTTASLNAEKTLATITITNLANVAADFKSYFFSPNSAIAGLVNTTYTVSAVPVPAALPLFGLALAGAAGYSRRKKKMA